MANSSAGLVKRLDRFGTAINGVTKSGVNQSALLVTTSVAGFLGGRSKLLRGVSYPRGAKVGVRYDIKGALNPTALVYMTGPAHFVERDTRPHAVGVRAEKRGNESLMLTPQGVRTGPWVAGGSKGRHPFAKGVAAAGPRTREVYRRGVHSAARSIFGS